MNREILFRGKRVNNGEWVEGYYVCLMSDQHRIYTGFAETDTDGYGKTYYPDFYAVAPETVGRYTGLTDKNGAEIFEGDIVKAKQFKNSEIEIWKVVFNQRSCGFEMWRDVTVGVYGEKSTKQRNFGGCECFCVFEVIGNIHDNPELLEK